MLDTYDLQRAMDALLNAREVARTAEYDRQRAWERYLAARDRKDEAEEALAVAERVVVREASRLAGQERRPNRDARRAQVMAGVDGAYEHRLGDVDYGVDDIPF